jgi:ATP-dependent DNA helicase RecQ
MVRLTAQGRAVMKAEAPARLLLPANVEGTRAPSRGRGRATPSPMVEGDVDEALFEALRRYRLHTARDEGVPPYVVAGDRTLREIAVVRPTSLDELGTIYGIGPAKAVKYGQALLDVVARGAAAPSAP